MESAIENRSQRRRHGPIVAYSEFMPPPRPAGKVYPYDPFRFFDDDDHYGWPVSEAEDLLELQPGLQHVAGIIVHALASLAAGHSVRGMTAKSWLIILLGRITWRVAQPACRTSAFSR